MRVLLFLLLISTSLFAQNDYNNYKYVIVPTQFGFQSSPDQYRVNTLLRYLFKKKGFEVYMDTETYPRDLAVNNCKALKANMETSGVFNTKTIISLVDCTGNVLLISEEGVSKKKDYKEGYHESIRNAFETLSNYTYSYVAPENDIYAIEANGGQEEVEETVIIEDKGVEQLYTLNDEIYVIVPVDGNDSFGIFKKNFSARDKSDENVKVGDLIKGSRPGSYILKMMDGLQASAYFDSNKNLVFDKIGTDGNIKTEMFTKVAN